MAIEEAGVCWDCGEQTLLRCTDCKPHEAHWCPSCGETHECSEEVRARRLEELQGGPVVLLNPGEEEGAVALDEEGNPTLTNEAAVEAWTHCEACGAEATPIGCWGPRDKCLKAEPSLFGSLEEVSGDPA